ncbi:hypothetical protein GCM10027052_22510 [Parafrigoribacterium mesophilum]|uniref:hypothetical protein n=1 Tax=Parafrigoribacterium mesophilum TaxID=433646 RepID=UPI0031FD4B93
MSADRDNAAPGHAVPGPDAPESAAPESAAPENDAPENASLENDATRNAPDGAATAPRRSYWPVPLARAVPAGILGLYITFSADHSAQLGLILFGAFALVSGAIMLLLRDRFADRVVRVNVIVQGVLAALLGAMALLFNGGGLGLLLLLLPAFMAITGFLELYSGLRARRHPGVSRDWLTVGAFTAVAALVFLLIPQDSVLAIGLLGAYGILLCVYLIIGALSLKWGTQNVRGAAAPAERTN